MRTFGSTSLISILKSATELDRLDDLRLAVTECYTLAIRSVSQYAVEVDPNQSAEFRLHLKDIEQQWLAAKGAAGLQDVQASFRGELREYRDQTREQLARLRKELENAAAAMASFAGEIASHGADHEKELKGDLERLERVSTSDDLQVIRGGIRTAVGEIAVSLDQMRRGNQLIVAQLQDEIRVLHQEFQAERRALFTDRASGAWTRQKLDLKIHELLRQDDRFSIIAVAVRNLPRIKLDHSRALVEVTLKALLMRLRGLLGADTTIGRWNEQEFVAVLDLEPDTLGAIADELAKKLRGPYAAQENGMAHSVLLDVATAALEYPAGSDPASFVYKLERTMGTLLPNAASLQ
jgi:GGDEF domain-containing protein